MRLLTLGVVLPVLILSSCTKQDTPAAGAPQATVTMRDGTQTTGAVISSSPTEIKLAGSDNITRTIPMSQVRSVDYGDATAEAPSTAQAPGTPRSAAEYEPAHVNHRHPVESAITSKTY